MSDIYGSAGRGYGYADEDEMDMYGSGDGQGGRQQQQGTGMGSAYQMAPLVVGGLMAALGLRRGGWLGYGIALAGLGVMQQSFSGKPDLYEWAGYGDRVDHDSRAVTAAHTMTISRPREEIYKYFRDFSNLAKFMKHVDRIDIIDNDHSHWVVLAPGGLKVSWQAEITDDQPNRRVAWRSMDGADVPNWGHVEFREAPAGRGTEMHVVIRYEPPGGMLGRAIARALGREPQVQLREDLERFKRIMETGEGALSSRSSTASMASAI